MVSHRIAPPALAGFAALSLLALPASAQRTPDVRLNTDAAGVAFASNAEICSVGEWVYVSWSDTRNGAQDIYFTRSTDGGSTWSATDVRLNTDPAGTSQSVQPKIACHGTDVYVVWSDFRNGGSVRADIYLNYSNDHGATWQGTDIRLDTSPMGATLGSASRAPAICVDGAGVYIAWIDGRTAPFDDIYFNRSTDNGATWLGTDVRLDTDAPGGSISFEPSITCTGGNVYVGWADFRGLPMGPEIRFNRSTDSGTTWLGADVRIDNPPGASSAAQPAMTSVGNKVYLVWSDTRSGLSDVFVNYSTDNGTTFQGADTRLDTGLRSTGLSNDPGEFDSFFPQVEVSGLDVYVVWEEARNGSTTNNADPYFQHSADGGATWLAADVQIDQTLPATGGGGGDHSPAGVRFGVDGDHIFVLWGDFRTFASGLQNVFYNRSLDKGVTWLPFDVRMENLSTPAGTHLATEPEIAVSGDDVHLIWLDNRNGATDVYYTIPFGLIEYGTSKPGTGGLEPKLKGTGESIVGKVFNLEFTDGFPNAIFGLVLGGAKAQINVLGGTVWVQPFTVPALGLDNNGELFLPLPLPNDTAFVGGALYWQGLIFDPGATGGVSMTNAVENWIG